MVKKECPGDELDLYFLTRLVLLSLVLLGCFPVLYVYMQKFGWKLSCQFWALVSSKGKDHRYFERELRHSVMQYVVLMVLTNIASWWWHIGEKFRQKNFSMNLYYCSFCQATVWVLLTLTHMSFQQIMMNRLIFSFAGTTYSVSDAQIYAFNGVQATLAIALITAVTAQVALVSCYYPYNVVDAGFVKWDVYTCGYSQSKKGVQQLLAIVLFLVIFVCNTTLTAMYLMRLRRVFSPGQSVEPSVASSKTGAVVGSSSALQREHSQSSSTAAKGDFRMILVMRKTAIVAVISQSSTIICSLLALGTNIITLVNFDLLLNSVLLYCLFSSGHDIYVFLFGWLERALEPCFPQSMKIPVAFLEEHPSIYESSTKTRTQQKASEVAQDGLSATECDSAADETVEPISDFQK